MKYRMTQNLVSQSVSHGLVDSKSCVKNAVDIC